MIDNYTRVFLCIWQLFVCRDGSLRPSRVIYGCDREPQGPSERPSLADDMGRATTASSTLDLETPPVESLSLEASNSITLTAHSGTRRESQRVEAYRKSAVGPPGTGATPMKAETTGNRPGRCCCLQ